MDSNQRQTIQKNYVNLTKNLECSADFLSYFVPEKILTETMIEDIMARTGRSKNIFFWTSIQKKGTHAYHTLYDALVETYQYDVADLLKPELAPSRLNATEPVQETGYEGGGAAGGASGGGPGGGRPSEGGGPGGGRPSGGGEPWGGRPSGGGGGDGDSNSGGSGRPEEVDRPATAVYADDVDSDLSDDDEYLDERRDYLDEIRLRVNPCWKPAIKNLFYSESVYRMSTPTRGRCLVINNRYFDEPSSAGQERLEQRDGSEMDVKNISNVFQQLSFDCHIKHDLTAQEMLNVIKEETKHGDHKGYGAFVLVIMTHGTENDVYGKDGLPIKHSDIFDLMSPYKFPALAGRPKILIFQACSGGRSDTMGRFANDGMGSDARPPPSQFPQASNTEPAVETKATAVPSSPVEKPFPGAYLSTDDMYIMKASFLSYVSSRHTRQGTWFIRAITEVLYKHASHRDVQSLFKQIQRKVRNKSIISQRMYGHTSGQMPTDTCTFRDGKKLYLFPGYNPADHAQNRGDDF